MKVKKTFYLHDFLTSWINARPRASEPRFVCLNGNMAAAKNGPSSSTEEQEANFDYQEVWENGRKQYECGSCHRYFTTMRSTLYHLHTMHGKSTTFYGCCLLGFELLKSSIMSKIYSINEMNYHWRNIWYFCYRLHLWNYAAIKLDIRMKWF